MMETSLSFIFGEVNQQTVMLYKSNQLSILIWIIEIEQKTSIKYDASNANNADPMSALGTSHKVIASPTTKVVICIQE